MGDREKYLRQIELYGSEGVLEAVRDDRYLFSSADVVSILRACIRSGMKLKRAQAEAATAAMRKSGMDEAEITDVLKGKR